MKNDTFHILWYVNLYIYMDLMEFEINTNTNTNTMLFLILHLDTLSRGYEHTENFNQQLHIYLK
jgi:hypothetical protein